MTNVLALDLGTKCGWALSESRRIESGVQTFDVKRGESPGMRWLRFNRWLGEMVLTFGDKVHTPRVDLIVYEAVLGRFARGQAQTHIASNLAGRVEEFCATHALDIAPVPDATLKKFVAGRGRFEKGTAKREMHKAASARSWLPTRLGEYHKDHEDEVDAICLLHYALEELVPEALPCEACGSRHVGRCAVMGEPSPLPAGAPGMRPCDCECCRRWRHQMNEHASLVADLLAAPSAVGRAPEVRPGRSPSRRQRTSGMTDEGAP